MEEDEGRSNAGGAPFAHGGGQPGRSGPPGNSNAAKHYLYTVKHDMKLLTSLAMDRRTDKARQVEAVRGDLLADLGGAANLSKQERLLIDEAAFLVLQLASVNVWLAKQPALVNKRTRALHPVVRERLLLVGALRQLLNDLGLKRRAKDVQTLESYLASRAANGHTDAAPAPAQTTPVVGPNGISDTNLGPTMAATATQRGDSNPAGSMTLAEPKGAT